MASFSLTLGGTALPDGVTDFKRSDELLWSEGTGRSASNGLMSGSVVARKQTYSVTWGGLVTAAQYNSIRAAASAADYMPFSASAGGSQLASCTVYRGVVSGDFAGVFGGTGYFRNVSLELVER